jgi:hypothetical protein
MGLAAAGRSLPYIISAGANLPLLVEFHKILQLILISRSLIHGGGVRPEIQGALSLNPANIFLKKSLDQKLQAVASQPMLTNL